MHLRSQVQGMLDDFLRDRRLNRLLLLVLSRRVREGNFTFNHCRDAVLDKAAAGGRPVACLVVSGKSVTIALSSGRVLQQKTGSTCPESIQPQQALMLIDQVNHLQFPPQVRYRPTSLPPACD